MSTEAWLERWREGRIGFHSDGVHPDLDAHAERFLGGGPHRVLVPLCGKTVDLHALAVAGHTSVGVELSALAVEQFHVEHDLSYVIETHGDLQRYRSERCEIWCGDLFALTPERVGPIQRVWDRASLVAIEPSRRAEYVAQVSRLASGGLLLLNAFDYDPAVMDGPPFPVSLDQVRSLYGADRVEVLTDADRIDDMPKWRERGHGRWQAHTSLVRL